VSFVRKTKAVIGKQLAPSFLILVRTADCSSLANKQNYIVSHTVLGAYGSAPLMQDIASIDDRVQAMRPAAAEVGMSLRADKFMITGWFAETQLVNVSSSTAYVDCYYWRSVKNFKDAGDGAGGTGLEFGDLWLRTLQLGGSNFPVGGSALDPLDYGMTPFQSATLAQYCRIWKKTRIKLGAGGTAQLETRSGRNYYIDAEYARNYTFLRGKTEGIFMIVYGVPSTTHLSEPVRVLATTNVNYTYRVLQGARTTGGIYGDDS